MVGTDDDHHVVGCQSMGLADTVTNILHSHCDPPPSITIEAVPYQDKELFLIRVAQSHDAVHAVKELGPFIRANATKRAPTSRELWLRNLKLKLRLNWNLMTTSRALGFSWTPNCGENE